MTQSNLADCKINPSEGEINKFIDNRIQGKSQNKVAIIMVGGPGSGKSSGRDKTLEMLEMKFEQFVNIDPDEIIGSLFNNDNDFCILSQPSLIKGLHVVS